MKPLKGRVTFPNMQIALVGNIGIFVSHVSLLTPSILEIFLTCLTLNPFHLLQFWGDLSFFVGLVNSQSPATGYPTIHIQRSEFLRQLLRQNAGFLLTNISANRCPENQYGNGKSPFFRKYIFIHGRFFPLSY